MEDRSEPQVQGPASPPVMAADDGSGSFVLSDVSMSFGPTVALDQVGMTIHQGQVHGLVGHNGSGKSTLAKILTGYHRPSAGSLRIGSEVLALDTEHDLDRLGIAAVHQDLCLNHSMTVLENLTVAIEDVQKSIKPIHWNREGKAWATYLRTLGVRCRLTSMVSELSPSDRAGIAIARALRKLDASEHRGLLIIDEATAYFSAIESDRFAEILRNVTGRGHAVLFIGHNLNEVLTVCDVVTVLRNGKVVATVSADETTSDDLVVYMLGRKPESSQGGRSREHEQALSMEPAVVVNDLTCGPAGKISFHVLPGEIVGVTGIVGSGYDLLPYLILGLGAIDGHVRIGGKAVRLSPVNAARYGVSLVPSDRAAHGVWLAGTCQENYVIGRLGRYLRGGLLSGRDIARDSAEMMRSYLVRPPDRQLQLAKLSGGNQQKVMLASRIVPSVTKVLNIIHRQADEGTAVLVMSADHQDLLNVCDRLIVLRVGAGIVLDQAATSLSESEILTACMGQHQAGSIE
jgi:ribose transport system ATP-binding protein